MKDFNYYAPTRVVFGRQSEEKLPQLLHEFGAHKVLIHYGGGSARRSGLLDKVEQMLQADGMPFVELGGVVPNPLLSKVKEGIALARKEKVDFILAVGGGSVIDSSKAIGYGVPMRVTCGISGQVKPRQRRLCPWEPYSPYRRQGRK